MYIKKLHFYCSPCIVYLYIYLENYIFIVPLCIYLESGYALYLITNLQIIKPSDFTNMDYRMGGLWNGWIMEWIDYGLWNGWIMEWMDYGMDGLWNGYIMERMNYEKDGL